jgi:serine O-acetyltransferase
MSDKNGSSDNIGLIKLIQSDMRIWKEDLFLTKLGFYSAVAYRISRCLYIHKIKLLSQFIQFISHIITGAEISHKANIGPGLRLLHPTGVVIGPYVRIGMGAVICQGCGIVSNGEIGQAEPVIGDKLWAGPGSKIMGAIILGDKVAVGPNSVVLKNVESNMLAFGIPARVMSKDFKKLLK